MAWIERAMERMYGDINLTDELVDEEAKQLLKWGEAEHAKLEAQGLDDEALDDKAGAVRKAMKRVNRFIGNRGSDDPERTRKALSKLADALVKLGYNVTVEQLEAALEEKGASDNMAALQVIFGMLEMESPATEETLDAEATQDSAAIVAETAPEAIVTEAEETPAEEPTRAVWPSEEVPHDDAATFENDTSLDLDNDTPLGAEDYVE